MKSLTLISIIILGSLHCNLAQSEREIMVFLSRICINDSVKATIQLPPNEGDTLANFYFTPINPEDEADLALYEFDKYRTTFDTKINLEKSKFPYGSITILSYSETKCQLLLEIYGLGERKSLNLWQHAIFSLDISKGGRWYLSGVAYSHKVYGEPDPVEPTSGKGKKNKN